MKFIKGYIKLNKIIYSCLNIISIFISEIAEIVEENVSSMIISEVSLVYADKQTINQAESITWHMLREGRLTGSRVHDVLHTDQVHPAPSLIKRICGKSSVMKTSVPSLRWGIDHEKDAIADFMDYQISQSHESPAISKSGLVIKQDYPFLAASPDGLYICNCHSKALLEVKCPYTLKDTQSVEEAIESGTFYLDKDCFLKKSHRYYTQVQHQLYVCDYEKCHFIVWTPQWMQITLIDRDDDFIQSNLPKLINFFKVHFMPELLTRIMLLLLLNCYDETSHKFNRFASFLWQRMH